MEPNYSRHALICASCRSITRGVTLAFQSPSVCFEICDNQSRLPFVTACSVWCRGKKAWPIAMEEFPCFWLKNSPPLFPYCTQMITAQCVCLCWLNVNVNICVWVFPPWCACDEGVCVSASCSSVESEGDQTVSQLPWEGSSGCGREERAKYPGSNTLLCLSHNEVAHWAQTTHTHTQNGQSQGTGQAPPWSFAMTWAKST